MTPAELDQLRALAQAATPGPWRVEARGHASQEVARVNNLEVAPPDSAELAHCATDAAYIAAVSPDVVLALLSDVERLTLLSRESTAWHEISRREAAMLRRQRDALQSILDRRPTLNDGLREAYAAWTAEVYAMDASGSVGEEGEHCMRTSSDPDTRRRVPSGAEMRAVADALGNLGTKTRGR